MPRTTAFFLVATLAIVVGAGQPTHKDLRYSKDYTRSVLDLWVVKGRKPAPLVVYFHGGGFKAGDKSRFRRNYLLRRYHPKGVAFASVNYPLLKHINNNYLGILMHCSKAVQFLIDNADKYNIDKDRISVMGVSAGALISGYLGHGTKLPIKSVFLLQQPMGTNLLTIPFLRRNGPLIVLYNASGRDDRIHHPDNAKLVEKRCRQLEIPCEVYGSKASGLAPVPRGKRIEDLAMARFYKSWDLPVPGE